MKPGNAKLEEDSTPKKAAQRRAKGRPHARKLLKLLEGKTNVLITADQKSAPIGSMRRKPMIMAMPIPARSTE